MPAGGARGWTTCATRALPAAPATIAEQQALWDSAVAECLFVVCKTPIAKQITRRTLMGFRKGQVNARYFEDLINQIRHKPDNFVRKMHQGHNYWKANNDDNMKFNAIVGNPPYQEEGISTRKAPVYHYFYDVSFRLCDRVTLITPARFLFRAGQTPSEWTERILADKHFKVVDYFQHSDEVFPNIDIKGGVAITYRDANRDFGGISFFSVYAELRSILQKVKAHEQFVQGGFCEMVSSQGLYRFTDRFFNDFPRALEVQGKGTGAKITSNSLENLPEAFTEEAPTDRKGYIQMMGRSKNQRVTRWIWGAYVQEVDSLNHYKVFVPEANGTGAIGEVLSTPIIGTPMIGHSDTFLSVGRFKSQGEAEACLKYIKSKFARTMLGTLKATQHNPKDTWANVPLQDFTSSSDIDWSRSVSEIDRQLYRKYGLSEEEQAFIERMIKPMD